MNDNQRFWVYGGLALTLSAQLHQPKLIDSLIFFVFSLGFFVAAGHALLAPVLRKAFRRSGGT